VLGIVREDAHVGVEDAGEEWDGWCLFTYGVEGPSLLTVKSKHVKRLQLAQFRHL